MSSSAIVPAACPARKAHRFGIAWVLLALAIALHVTDEALTDFLSVFNPTAQEIHRRVPWLPAFSFTFDGWLTSLIIGIILLLALSPFAFLRARWMRPVAIVLSVLMILNACGHTLGTILGHSFPDIRFPRPMPGFYSSPFLFAAAINLLMVTRRESRVQRQPVS